MDSHPEARRVEDLRRIATLVRFLIAMGIGPTVAQDAQRPPEFKKAPGFTGATKKSVKARLENGKSFRERTLRLRLAGG